MHDLALKADYEKEKARGKDYNFEFDVRGRLLLSSTKSTLTW